MKVRKIESQQSSITRNRGGGLEADCVTATGGLAKDCRVFKI
jgi:hypothetical protein